MRLEGSALEGCGDRGSVKRGGTLREVESGVLPEGAPAHLVASSLEVNPLALRKNKKVRWQ